MTTKQTRADRHTVFTASARDLVGKRLQRQPVFASALLQEAMEQLIDEEVVIAQLLMRDITNNTIGFSALAEATGIKEKSLMRMLSVKGNPQAKNLFRIVHALQQLNGIQLEVRAMASGTGGH